MKKEKSVGLTAFCEYYSSVYGDRWPSLLAALQNPEQKIRRHNLFLDDSKFINDDTKYEELKPLIVDGATTGNSPNFYFMDLASLLPVLALCPKAGEVFGDFCAAPGGKALAALELMRPLPESKNRIFINEISDNRRLRLRSVLYDYLGENWPNFLTVTGRDAGLIGRSYPETFDAVLADVPCSGERHLLQNSEELDKWTPSRSKKLAIRQYAILASAFQSLKPGGRLVYSTCSISKKENDEVVEKLLYRNKSAKVENRSFSWTAATEFGQIVLPDETGFGPIFYSLIHKSDSILD